jgi:hypothetical protein
VFNSYSFDKACLAINLGRLNRENNPEKDFDSKCRLNVWRVNCGIKRERTFVLAYPSKDARFCLISTYLAPIVDE